jgi:acyl-CoA thioester hydrolase
VFEYKLLVQSADIDAMNHVNNVVYLRYAQEVAEAHWQTKGSELLRQKYSWVVLRHEIDYFSPSLLGHNLVGSTWVDDPNGPKIVRNVELFNVNLNKITAKVRTTWCLLDATSLRPRRIEGEMIALFL